MEGSTWISGRIFSLRGCLGIGIGKCPRDVVTAPSLAEFKKNLENTSFVWYLSGPQIQWTVRNKELDSTTPSNSGYSTQECWNQDFNLYLRITSSALQEKKKNHILVLRLSFVFEVINNYHEAQLLRITVKYKKILLKRRKAR